MIIGIGVFFTYKCGDRNCRGGKLGKMRGWQVKLCDLPVTHEPYMSALETGHNKALYEFPLFTSTLLYGQTNVTLSVVVQTQSIGRTWWINGIIWTPFSPSSSPLILPQFFPLGHPLLRTSADPNL